MNNSRSLTLVLAAAVAACSSSPVGLSGPPNVAFAAAPAVVPPGDTVHLTLTNLSAAAIGVGPCPITLERWDGSAWVGAPGPAILCPIGEDTLGPYGRFTHIKLIDPAAVEGTYRAGMGIHAIGSDSGIWVTSNTFSVMP